MELLFKTISKNHQKQKFWAVVFLFKQLLICFPEIYLHHKAAGTLALETKWNQALLDRHQLMIFMKDLLMA